MRRHRRRTGLVDAADRHAHVLGLDHHRDAARLEDLFDRGGDLRGEMLLRLQAVRIDIDQPRQLRQADDPVGRHVGDMRLAVERHHVVFAVRIELDVLDQDEVVIAAGLAEGAVEHLGRAGAVAFVDFLIGVDDALGRIEHAFARGVVAGKGDQGAHGGLGLLARRARPARRRRGPHMVGQALLGEWLDN